MMPLGIQGLRIAFDQVNVQAMLRLIRERETKQEDSAYGLINGGAHFSDFSMHPYHGVPTTKGGRAAGAYQFLGTTWARLCEQYGFADFAPATQDLGAVALIQGRGALPDVVAGRLEAAVQKLRPEWTSLPGAAEATAGWTMDKARACYAHWGGLLEAAGEAAEPATQPAAPIEQRDLSGIPPREEPAMSDTAQTTPSFDWSSLLNVGGTFVTAATTALGSPLAGALVGGLVSAFKPVLQDKITKEIGRHTDAATANMVGTELTKVITDTTAAVTQKSDPATAIAEVRADPAKLAVVEQAVDQKLADMLPVLNEMHRQAQERFAAESADRNDAASRVIRVGWNIQKPLVQGGLLINIGTVAFLLLALVVQIILAADHKPDPTLIAFGGPIIVMTLRGLERAFAFAFGGTPEGSPADLSRQGKPQ